MLSLSVILFSDGMDTKRRDIEPVSSQGLMLSTVELESQLSELTLTKKSLAGGNVGKYLDGHRTRYCWKRTRK